MGVAGVVIATDLSAMFSAFLVLRRLAKDAVFRFAILSQRSARNGAWSILKTGIPSAVQGAVFCFANIFVQASVNRFGADAIVGSTIAMNFEYVTYYIITGVCSSGDDLYQSEPRRRGILAMQAHSAAVSGLVAALQYGSVFCDCPVPRYALGAFYAECCGHSERRRADFVHAAL